MSVPAIGTARAAPAQHPLARLHELHDEASILMRAHNDHFGGDWELRIRAPEAPHPVVYKQARETPNQRIEAAIKEIQAAFWEKWPGAPLSVQFFDQGPVADGNYSNDPWPAPMKAGALIVLVHRQPGQLDGTAIVERRGAGHEKAVRS